MADRPILFSGPMVRALLDGRKTMTRRVLKPASISESRPGIMWPQYLNGQRIGESSSDPEIVDLPDADGGTIEAGPTPYCRGDRLWVRETLQVASNDQDKRWLAYAADGKDVWPLTEWRKPRNSIPSIHMPRWASRLTLIVTEVRVQRLQEISEADAIAEGIERSPHGNGDQWIDYPAGSSASGWSDPRESFRSLWDSLNADRGFGWDDNPWIVAVSFAIECGNIDQIGRAA